MESPFAYLIAVIAAIAVFVNFNRSDDSIVRISLMSTREALLELGYKGLRATLMEAIDFES